MLIKTMQLPLRLLLSGKYYIFPFGKCSYFVALYVCDRHFESKNLEKKELSKKAFIWLFKIGISRIICRIFAQIRRLEVLYFSTSLILLP